MNSTRKIRVLHALTTTAGGLGRSVLTLVRSLDPDLFEVSVAFGPGYPFDRAFVESGLPVYPVRMQRGLSPTNLLGGWDLHRVLQTRRFDIVHAHASQAGLLARSLARLHRVPAVVFTLHGYATVDEGSPLWAPFLWSIDRALDACTDHYVAISRSVEQTWLRRGVIRPERVTTIHHGIVPAPPMPAEERNERKAALGIGAVAPTVATVSLLEERKGIEFLIRAVPSVLARLPDCVFLIVGDGHLRESLTQQAHRLGVAENVRFLGWRDDAEALIGLVDVFCLPSLREAFGLVLLEAMAQERPVVATRVQGVPEVVEDGKTGLLVSPGDAGALGAALLRVLSNRSLARELGERGRKRVRTHFDVASMSKRYADLYLRLLDERAERLPT